MILSNRACFSPYNAETAKENWKKWRWACDKRGMYLRAATSLARPFPFLW